MNNDILAERVRNKSSLEREKISWNSAETMQCCLCSLSSAPLPEVQVA